MSSMRGNRRSTLGQIEIDAARFTYIDPTSLGSLGLWYDWSLESVGVLATITDRSGSGRNGTISSINAFIRDGIVHGMTANNNAKVQFSNINLRTVIRVMMCNYPALFLMSDTSNFKFHWAWTAFCDATWADNAVKNGAWRANGRVIANPTAGGSATEYPGIPVIVSCVTTGAVDQDRLGFDRTFNFSHQIFMEDLVFTDALSLTNIKKIEHYLALKWNITDYIF